MILYHGSNQIIRQPKLVKVRRTLDFGPVADDDVYRTFALYASGVFTRKQTIEQLKIKRLYNQLVSTTEKALSYLQFIGTVPDEELL